MTQNSRYRQVAALHAAHINKGFLATLGLPFLSLMYRAIDEAEGSVLLTEEIEGRVVGFVAGSEGMAAIYRKMLRYPARLALSLLPSLVRPNRLMRILELLRYGGGASTEQLPRAELLSIAVDLSVRGAGVSERLYRRLQAHFAERGVRAFRIVVGDSLAAAHRYYRKMGASEVARIEVHAGEGSIVYVQESRFVGNRKVRHPEH